MTDRHSLTRKATPLVLVYPPTADPELHRNGCSAMGLGFYEPVSSLAEAGLDWAATVDWGDGNWMGLTGCPMYAKAARDFASQIRIAPCVPQLYRRVSERDVEQAVRTFLSEPIKEGATEMAHPTYAEAQAMTKAELIDYIESNNTNDAVVVRKSWKKDQLLNAYKEAFPGAEAPKQEKAERESTEGEINMTFGLALTEYLEKTGWTPVGHGNTGRGRFIFTPDESETVIDQMEKDAESDEYKDIRRNLRLAIERVESRQ